MPVQPTAESQFRNRARKALLEGKNFEARGEVNKVILQEVRTELAQEVALGRKRIRDTAYRAEARVEVSIGNAEDRALQAIETSKQKALDEISSNTLNMQERNMAFYAKLLDGGKLTLSDEEAAEWRRDLPAAVEAQHSIIEAGGLPSTMSMANVRKLVSQSDDTPEPMTAEPSATSVCMEAEPSATSVCMEIDGGSETVEAEDRLAITEFERCEEIVKYGSALEEMSPEERVTEIQLREIRDQQGRREARMRKVENKMLKRQAIMDFELQKSDFNGRMAGRASERAKLLESLPAKLDQMPEWHAKSMEWFFACGYGEFEEEKKERLDILRKQKNFELLDVRAECSECTKDDVWCIDTSCDKHRAVVPREEHAAAREEVRQSFLVVAAVWALEARESKLQQDEKRRLKSIANEYKQEEAIERNHAISSSAAAEMRARCRGCLACEDHDPLFGAFCEEHMNELEELKDCMASAALE